MGFRSARRRDLKTIWITRDEFGNLFPHSRLFAMDSHFGGLIMDLLDSIAPCPRSASVRVESSACVEGARGSFEGPITREGTEVGSLASGGWPVTSSP
jgi:hypothetical protein